MQIYKTKTKKFSGTNFREVPDKASRYYTQVRKLTRRRTYIRSTYFDGEKIFIDLFWHHLFEKSNWRDRIRRMRFFNCAVELIQNSHFKPSESKDPNSSNEKPYRFYGADANNELFCVQIKEKGKKKQKFLISVFPVEGPISVSYTHLRAHET